VYLFKLKNIFSKFPKTDVKSLALLYFYSKNNFKNINVFGVLNQFSNSNDTLVIGKSYDYLANNVELNNGNNIALVYYLRLLENQYLPIKKIDV
jgi:sigma54-dependent transcription regulator|tara:strand:- start:744 stop:1025 length:282 start_codon:yes stop_codon:yes gene_type:complete